MQVGHNKAVEKAMKYYRIIYFIHKINYIQHTRKKEDRFTIFISKFKYTAMRTPKNLLRFVFVSIYILTSLHIFAQTTDAVKGKKTVSGIQFDAIKADVIQYFEEDSLSVAKNVILKINQIKVKSPFLLICKTKEFKTGDITMESDLIGKVILYVNENAMNQIKYVATKVDKMDDKITLLGHSSVSLNGTEIHADDILVIFTGADNTKLLDDYVIKMSEVK